MRNIVISRDIGISDRITSSSIVDASITVRALNSPACVRFPGSLADARARSFGISHRQNVGTGASNVGRPIIIADCAKDVIAPLIIPGILSVLNENAIIEISLRPVATSGLFGYFWSLTRRPL